MDFLLPKSKRNEDWTSRTIHETVLTLVNSGGSLRRVAQKAFRSVQFSIGKRFSVGKNCDIQLRGRHKEEKHLMQALPAGTGEGTQTMFISSPLSSAFSRAIAEHCTGLRKLSFQPYCGSPFPNVNFCAIIAARGPILESLEISSFPGSDRLVAAIGESCCNLIHLKLSCAGIVCSFAQLWTSAGKNLQHLELGGCVYDPRFSLQNIFPNCPNISRLSFGFWEPEGHQAVDDLCKLYGPRLTELKTQSYGMEAVLLRIAEACPNISIDFPTISSCTEIDQYDESGDAE